MLPSTLSKKASAVLDQITAWDTGAERGELGFIPRPDLQTSNMLKTLAHKASAGEGCRGAPMGHDDESDPQPRRGGVSSSFLLCLLLLPISAIQGLGSPWFPRVTLSFMIEQGMDRHVPGRKIARPV